MVIVWPPWKSDWSTGWVIVTTGGVPTVIGSVTVSVPGVGVRLSLTVSVTT